MEKLRMRTTPSPVELLAILRDACPQSVVETVGADGVPKLAVDVDALRAALGESALPEWQERYGRASCKLHSRWVRQFARRSAQIGRRALILLPRRIFT